VTDAGGEFGHLGVAADAVEGALGFDHSGRDPSFLHVAVLPVLDPVSDDADGGDHRLDAVRVRQRPAQRAALLRFISSALPVGFF
jgi:hypothetical protein